MGVTRSHPAPGSVGGGTGLAVTSVASVQFGAAIAAHLFSRVGPLGTVSIRLVGAALVLVLVTRPWRRTWTRREIGTSLLFGMVFTAMNVTLYLAIDRLPLATVITLEFLGPLTVSLATASGWRTRVWGTAGRARRRTAGWDGRRRRPRRCVLRAARRVLLGQLHPDERTGRT